MNTSHAVIRRHASVACKTVNVSGWLAGVNLGAELDSGSIKLDSSGNRTLDATGQVTTAPKAVVQAQSA